MKKFLIPVLLVILAAAVCLLPLPSRVNTTHTGWLLTGDGEVLASDVEITVEGWQFRYLLREDRLSVQITATSSSCPDAHADYTVDGTCFTDAGTGQYIASSPCYVPASNSYCVVSLTCSQNFQELLLSSSDSPYLWLSSSASSPEEIDWLQALLS